MKETFLDIITEIRKAKIKGSFAQNVSVVFGGNVLNFILQLIFAPIISRIYGPAAYGEYAYYNLIITNIVFLGGLNLPTLYVIPRPRVEYLALAKIVLSLTLLLILLSLGIFLLKEENNNYSLSSHLLLAAIFIIIVGTLNVIFGNWNARSKNFKKNSLSGISGNFMGKCSSIFVGLNFTASGIGLLAGDFFRSIVVFFLQSKKISRIVLFRFIVEDNWSYVFSIFKKYLDTPLFSFPANLLGKWSNDAYILIIGLFFSKEHLGYYSFAVTLLNIPLRLFESSIRPVMNQKAAEVFPSGNKQLGKLLLKSLKVTLGVSLIPASGLSIIDPFIFPIFFGKEWNMAGTVVSFLSIQFITQAILQPYFDFWRIVRKERRMFYSNLLSLFVRFFPLLLLIFVEIDFYQFLILSSVFSALGSIFMCYQLLILFFNRLKAIIAISTLTLILGLLYVIILSLVSYLEQL